MKVLVVEDHVTQLKLANHVLSASGHNVSDAANAEQAFISIKADRPEVILLDLTLPGMDGLTLARKLKADPETREIHVVALTSYPEKYSKSAALAAGCDAYLVKPMDTRKLSDQLITASEGGDKGNTP
jgi:CheY-like chemotaxis protein